MESENNLLNLIKHHLVLEYRERGEEAMCVSEFLPLCGALLYPFRDVKIIDAKLTLQIIKSIKSVLKKSKGLEQYSLDALRQYFKQKWLPKLSFKEQKGFLKGISLIENITDDGRIMIKDNDNVHNLYLNEISIPDISNNYGSEQLGEAGETTAVAAAEPSSDAVIEVVETVSEPAQELNINSRKQESEPLAKEQAMECVTKPADNREEQKDADSDLNKPFCNLYKKLLAKRENKEPDYAWQWLLTAQEYDVIKECVKKNPIPTASKMQPCTANLLALYIGEFYKREYDGSTSFSSSVSTDLMKKICELKGITPYKKNNKVHLFTLCVSGGLPVHYLSSKLDKNNTLINCLAKLFGDDERDALEGEALLDSLNTGLRESYHQKHAIYQYIQSIRDQQKVWDSTDYKNPDFKDFVSKIKEANNRVEERKKFKLYYSMWMQQDNSKIHEFALYPHIRFNPEENGERHFALSNQKLSSWGIQNPPAQFSLDICGKSLSFAWCCNGDYISANKVDQMDMSPLNLSMKPEELSVSNYIIKYSADGAITKPLESSQLVNAPFEKGYMQFYSDDDPLMALWSTFKGAQAYKWSGIMYDKSKYTISSKGHKHIDINNQIGWVSFQYCVTLHNIQKNKSCVLYNSKGRIYAKPCKESLHPQIVNNALIYPDCLVEGMVKCFVNKEELRAYVVKESVEFKVFRTSDDTLVTTTKIAYKDAGKDGNWQSYPSGKKLGQGLYKFQISCASYTTEFLCYVIPDNATIVVKNELDENGQYKIIFDNFQTGTVSSNDGIHIAKDQKGFYIRPTNPKEYFEFRIGTKEVFICLTTYPPMPQLYMHCQGKEISEAILIFSEDIDVQLIVENQCEAYKLSEKEEIYKYLFNALTSPAASKRVTPSKTQSGATIRFYTQNITNNVQNVNLRLLNLETNQLQNVKDLSDAKSMVKSWHHDGLLFQSLSNGIYPTVYYAPMFIPQNGQCAADSVKKTERDKRLTDYAKNKTYASEYAYKQFEIACEHRLYFAVFDSLLSICWDATKQKFKDPTPKYLERFLLGYIRYAQKQRIAPSVSGLIRLAKEFKFEWKSLKQKIKKSNNQALLDVFDTLTNI